MPNKLIDETSPYLLQHASNPVHWQAWNPAALQQARDENKPILLSIGYSACHWCHVMEHESFENPKIAEVMNQNFVCIKVDREERPDLDKIYQLAHQMLTRRPGGWPLTVALTPDGHAPFFAGTYFPPESRFNMPGFGELLEKISGHYAENAEKLSEYHHSFNRALEQLNPDKSDEAIADPQQTLDEAVATLKNQFDDQYGGFGDAPKFPHPSQMQLLLCADAMQHSSDSGEIRNMATRTLDGMANGGLFDHLGGGFFRYSVDRQWTIPHFEKMGYDNAQLLQLYSNAGQYYDNDLYRQRVDQTAQWVTSWLQQPAGGYAATLDADSEGEEGKYYVWSEPDLRAVLTEQQYNVLENYFGLFGEENFEGKWHFNINPEADMELLEKSPEILDLINQARSKLLELRNQRVAPALDKKILTSWNGLLISGMATAGRLLDQPQYVASAQKAADFIANNLWQGDRLLSVCAENKAHLNGYLDDYAFSILGLVDLLQANWRTRDLELAIAICDAMTERFEDTEKGGFFFTSHDHEQLLYRPKTGADDAIPSGNGAAILGLIKLGNLLGESRYLDSASRALQLFSSELRRHASVNALMTIALQYTRDEAATVIIRGTQEQSGEWVINSNACLPPIVDIYTIPVSEPHLPRSLRDKPGGADGRPCAYVCYGTRCSPPVTSQQELVDVLKTTDTT